MSRVSPYTMETSEGASLFGMARALFVVGLVATLAIACHARNKIVVAWPDAPLELRDSTDRDAAIDRFWALPVGPERERTRTEIADAIAKRIADALGEDRAFVAAQLLDQLVGLWQLDPATIGHSLASHAGLLRQLRAQFAKAGALEPAVQTLVVLAEVEPAQREAHMAELAEILAFGDDLAIAENGPDAVR